MIMKFVVGIKILAFVSLAVGLLLLFVCAWTFHSFWTGKIDDLSLNSNVTTKRAFLIQTKELSEDFRSNPQKFINTNEKVDTVAEIIEEIGKVKERWSELKMKWSEFKHFLLGSNGLALFSGFLQVLTNIVMICTGVKGVRSRSGCWKCTHLFLGTMLVVCLIVPAVFDLTQNSLTTLRKLFAEIQESLKQFKLKNLNLSIVDIFYGVLALDITVIFVLIILCCCLMRNADYDYDYA